MLFISSPVPPNALPTPPPLPPADFLLPNWMAAVVRNGLSCHDRLQVHLEVLSIGVSRCSSDYTRVPSTVRLTICIQIEKREYTIHAILWCSKACDCNIDKYDRRNALWLWNPKNHCCENMAPSLPQTSAEVTASLKFDFSISWISEHLTMLLNSLRALFLASGWPGSNWKYLAALVRATGVSGRFACGFQTDLHCADVHSEEYDILQSLCNVQAVVVHQHKEKSHRHTQCVTLYPALHPVLLELPLLWVVLRTCLPQSRIQEPTQLLKIHHKHEVHTEIRKSGCGIWNPRRHLPVNKLSLVVMAFIDMVTLTWRNFYLPEDVSGSSDCRTDCCV